MRYDHASVEEKWEGKWEEIGRAKPFDKPKFFMHFAYPGISGYQHVGHMRGFSYTDIICRYKRMRGFNVFFPLGTHATGNQALGFAKKVKNKDKDWLDYLKENNYPMKEIKKMEDVDYVVDYFNKDYQNNWRKFGFIADFDSFTCAIYSEYKKFIEWQFRKLNEHGLLIQKPYYATFCPNCGPVAVDPSETDISSGGNAEKNEYTLLKFKINDDYIVTATLRPETVFGQTNLWADPKQDYVRVKVGNETWICSPQCAEKLSFQKEKIEVVGKLKGKELIDKTAVAPGIDREIPILPSKFVDPNLGTGLVTSVPSDAPYDWMALHDLQSLGKYKDIQVIPIIKSKGGGSEAPGVDICKKMSIKDQNDPRLEQATHEVYKSGFHTGVMNQNCGEYAGLPVEKAKDQVKQWLIREGQADILYDLSEEVVCRCGGHVVIKLIPDAWFINYGGVELTDKSKDHVKTMEIMPKEYKENLPSILDWFQERACARLGNWLGTPLPFDEEWTIEPISDSTLYPAFYVVSRFVNDGTLKPEDLTEQFFDYVYLGKGKPKEKWKKVRKEFEYWYPVDINLGGKEHQTVHFPVYIMNHVALLPPNAWPKGIFVNYWIIGKGGKISKSKGGANASPSEAAKRFSVDGLRLYYSHVGSPHSDVEWDENTAFSYKSHVEGLYSLVQRFKDFNSSSTMDAWLESRFNTKLKEFIEAMERYDLRSAVGSILFDFQRDLSWYEKRGGNGKIARAIVSDWIKCLSIFTPYVAEECWETLGNKKLVAVEQIPKLNEKKINPAAEIGEEIVRTTERDIISVIKLAGIKPKKISLFVAPEWKRSAWKKAKTLDRKTLMSELMKMKELKSKEGAKFAQYLQKKFHELGEIVSEKQEKKMLENAVGYLSIKFDTKVVLADASLHQKGANAVPGKPAILVE